MDRDELNKAVEEYLAKGGKITVYSKYSRSENVEYKRKWGRGRKKKEDGNSTEGSK